MYLNTVACTIDKARSHLNPALQDLEYDFGEGKDLFFTFEHQGEVYHAMFAPFKISYWP